MIGLALATIQLIINITFNGDGLTPTFTQSQPKLNAGLSQPPNYVKPNGDLDLSLSRGEKFDIEFDITGSSNIIFDDDLYKAFTLREPKDDNDVTCAGADAHPGQFYGNFPGDQAISIHYHSFTSFGGKNVKCNHYVLLMYNNGTPFTIDPIITNGDGNGGQYCKKYRSHCKHTKLFVRRRPK